MFYGSHGWHRADRRTTWARLVQSNKHLIPADHFLKKKFLSKYQYQLSKSCRSDTLVNYIFIILWFNYYAVCYSWMEYPAYIIINDYLCELLWILLNVLTRGIDCTIYFYVNVCSVYWHNDKCCPETFHYVSNLKNCVDLVPHIEM